MHKDELDERERATFERAMDAVRQMPPAEQYALIEHALAASIRYAATHKDQILTDWAHGLLTTLRTTASKAYQAATAGHMPPNLGLPGIGAKELLSAFQTDPPPALD